MKLPWSLSFLNALGALLLTIPAAAQSLNIDLGSYWDVPSSGYGAAGQAGAWSRLTGSDAGVVTLNLVGLDGNPTGVDATVYAGPDLGWEVGCAGDAQAMIGDDVYETGGDNWAVELTGLANGDYTLYLYAPLNPVVPTGSMTVNGTPVGGLTGHGCTPVAGSTYMMVNVTVIGGSLSVSGSGLGIPGYAGLAGMQLSLPVGNVAPALGPIGCTTAVAGSEVMIDLDAIDGNGDTITYSESGLPAGATLNSSTGAFTWTPNSSQSGQHQVTFYASDGSLSDSETIEILVSRFEREASLQTSFGIYNQGPADSSESHARAWLSDCPHTPGAGRPRCSATTDHLLGTGRDVEVPVELTPGPGTPDLNSTPTLPSGGLAAYNGTLSTDQGFGRLAHDGDPSNAAVSDAAGVFTLTTTASTSSRVGFLFERYLWVDADGARDEAHQKEEEADQLLDELVANDAQAQLLTVQPPTFGQLSLLSATFDTVAGSAGQGTPRLEVHLLCHGTLRIRLDGTNESGVNVIGDSEARYDTTALTGVSSPLSADAIYEEALALVGSFTITRIDFVADDHGGDGTRTYTLSAINVGSGGE